MQPENPGTPPRASLRLHGANGEQNWHLTRLVTASAEDRARARLHPLCAATRTGEGFVTAIRKCRVSVTAASGVTHTVEILGTSVFEVAAAGLSRLREDGWAEPLAPTTVVRVEVLAAPVVHEVGLKALERWANGPSVSPKQELLKRPLRHR